MSRLNDMLMEIGGIGRNEDGSITRLGFSEGYFQALEKVKERMESLGMQTEVDPVGNLHGVLPGKDPSLKSIVLGSHLDTVIKGGVFDGMLGVTGAEKPEPARIFMHGQPTFKFAVKAVPYCIDQVLEKAGMAIEDVDFFVFHQANARIIDLAAKKYHIPPEKYYKNIQKYGNTSAASIPLVISELHDLGKVGPGSRVLVVGFGGGLTWGGALVEFA